MSPPNYNPRQDLRDAIARRRERDRLRAAPEDPNTALTAACPYCAERLERRRRITPSGCWEWTGTAHRDGTGLIRLSGKLHRVHRVAHRVYLGRPAPPSLRHRCKNPKCFNPNHLQEIAQ